MYKIYDGRKYHGKGKVFFPKKKGDKFRGYVYVVKFWVQEAKDWIHKVGYSCNPSQRILDECRQYGVKEFFLIWVSPLWAESTARKKEYELRELGKQKPNWSHIPNDRFYLHGDETFSLELKVRKLYLIEE